MKTIITENQRGLLFKNGQFIKMLKPGKYWTLFNRKIEVLNIDESIHSSYAPLDVLLRNITMKPLTIIDVNDKQLALHYINEQFIDILPTGSYAFFNIYHQHTFEIIDISQPYINNNLSNYIFKKIPSKYFIKIDVQNYQKAMLFFNNQFTQLLESGTYYFWNGQTKIDYQLIDTRLMQINISGQEILSQDKVTLRINFVCQYKIIDYIQLFHSIQDYEEQIRIIIQLMIRKYIGQYKIDEILENRDMISESIFQELKEKAKDYYIEITEVGIKDIILPGEIREIMNTVLIAQKQAQANVITRREEVASTRSLLNTAKLMEENKTLYKLKELEYLERICMNVGEINVGGSQQLLSQLTRIMNGYNDMSRKDE